MIAKPIGFTLKKNLTKAQLLQFRNLTIPIEWIRKIITVFLFIE